MKKEKFDKNNYLNICTKEIKESFSFAEEDCPERVLKNYPKRENVIEVLKLLLDILFPGSHSAAPKDHKELDSFLRKKLLRANKLLKTELKKALPLIWLGEAARKKSISPLSNVNKEVEKISSVFFASLPYIRNLLIEDLKAAYSGDPAAQSFAEIKLSYPGMLAISTQRLAHQLYLLDVPVIPRIMGEWAHTKSGADIHPGAKIGKGFFIDHCTGVVIGETTEIGNNVKIYQGATLGAKSFPVDENGHTIKGVKRHPTVEDNVIIYANATILGGDTIIGKNSTIGAGVFLMQSVPPQSLLFNKLS